MNCPHRERRKGGETESRSHRLTDPQHPPLCHKWNCFREANRRLWPKSNVALTCLTGCSLRATAGATPGHAREDEASFRPRRLQGHVSCPPDDWSAARATVSCGHAGGCCHPGPWGRAAKCHPDRKRQGHCHPGGIRGASQGSSSKGRIQGHKPTFSGTPAHPVISGWRPASSPAPHLVGGAYLQASDAEKRPPDPGRARDTNEFLDVSTGSKCRPRQDHPGHRPLPDARRHS